MSFNKIRENTTRKCNCQSHFDIRAVCEPKSRKFRYCPNRAYTLFWMLGNDQDKYKNTLGIENDDTKRNKNIKLYCKKYHLNIQDYEQILTYIEEENGNECSDDEDDYILK